MRRRDFLKTAGTLTAGAVISERFDGLAFPLTAADAGAAAVVPASWRVRPFALTQVALGSGIFQQKRDRMLNYARNYGSATDSFAGPDRLLRNFRFTAGLDTKGAQPPGSWENATGYLRGHYAGHFMSMLAQAYAGTGDQIYKRKLDYMVAGLAECQDALAAAALRPTPRMAGRFGSALRLSGSPIGHAEHVSLPEGIVAGLGDFTIAVWINLAEYERALLSDSGPNANAAALNNGAAVFDFGNPNPAFGEAALTRMYLTVRASNEQPVPRFAITTRGADGEQRVDGSAPLPTGEWTHLAVTRQGSAATLFVNGVAAGTNGSMTLSPADLGVTKANWIGRCQFPQRNVQFLNAALDEFQIFDHALPADQVRSLTEGPGGKTDGGRVAWYRFDETSGPTATDALPGGRHGRILGPTDGRRHPGFLSAYPETPFIRLEEFATYGGNQGIWAPYYTLHKILAGLIDASQHADNAQALDVATKIGDWVHGRLAPLPQAQLDRMWNTYIAGEYGGSNDVFATLAALRPGSTDHVATAKRFINTAVYQPVVANNDILDGRHANQHIPQFIGYLRTYEQTREEDFHTAARNFWDMVVPHRVYSHGGVGVGEILRARDVIAGSLWQQGARDANHAETCPLYNMLKLSRNLFFHDPDPKYMNYYEQGLFNQILGSRRDVDSDASPMVTYFVPVRPGQRRSYGNVGTCCGGTGMENQTKYQDSIYFQSADGSALYVNLYIPSTLTWADKRFTVTQTTNYPFEGSSTLVVNGTGPLDLKLRVPAWVRKGFSVRVNGAAQRLEASPGTYLTLSRTWKPGDRVEVAMPLSFRVERAIDDPTVQSIFYGPTLLAVQTAPVGQDLNTGLIKLSFYRHMKLDGDLAPAMAPGAAPLHFTTGGYTLAPFFVADPSPDPESRTTAPYHVYVRRDEPKVVFGSIDSGVANGADDRGLTLLDEVWTGAPFANHRQFVAAVTRVADAWQRAGRLTAQDRTAILDAAAKAERDLA